MKVGIFGTGAYGLALSSVMNDNNIDITMWTKFEEEKSMLENTRKNDVLLPGYILDNNIKVTTSVEECMQDKDLLVIAIPAAFVDSLCIEMNKYIKDNQHICIASKGIEQNTGLFINNIVEKHIVTDKIAVISGPSFAKDMIMKKPIGLALATKNLETKEIVQKCMANSYLKLRHTYDVIGTEICGSVKNVIAIASGMLSGLGANDSTRAMLITEALHDIEEIIEAFNGDPDTVLSYAGFGDLLLTCTSEKSRNFTFGELLGKNTTKDEINEYLNKTTVEGYYTLESIYQLLNGKNAKIPIISIIYDIVKNDNDPEGLLTFLVKKA